MYIAQNSIWGYETASNVKGEFAVCMIIPDSPAARSGFTVEKAETRGKRLGSGALTYYSNIEYPRGCRSRNKLQYFQWDENILFNVPYELRFKHEVLADLLDKEFIKNLDNARKEKEASNKDKARRNNEVDAKRERNVAKKSQVVQQAPARQQLPHMDQVWRGQHEIFVNTILSGKNGAFNELTPEKQIIYLEHIIENFERRISTNRFDMRKVKNTPAENDEMRDRISELQNINQNIKLKIIEIKESVSKD